MSKQNSNNDVMQQLQLISNRLGEIDRRLDNLELRFEFLETRFDWSEQRFNTLDNRLSNLSMQQMQVNNTAFFGLGIALVSAAIAFVVARVSKGGS